MITIYATQMSDEKKLLPRDVRSVGCIIVDDLDDKDIAVSPDVVAERLKWVQSSITYENAKRIAQNECDGAYNKVIPYDDPIVLAKSNSPTSF
jgi:hypothetical protein